MRLRFDLFVNVWDTFLKFDLTGNHQRTSPHTSLILNFRKFHILVQHLLQLLWVSFYQTATRLNEIRPNRMVGQRHFQSSLTQHTHAPKHKSQHVRTRRRCSRVPAPSPVPQRGNIAPNRKATQIPAHTQQYHIYTLTLARECMIIIYIIAARVPVERDRNARGPEGGDGEGESYRTFYKYHQRFREYAFAQFCSLDAGRGMLTTSTITQQTYICETFHRNGTRGVCEGGDDRCHVVVVVYVVKRLLHKPQVRNSTQSFISVLHLQRISVQRHSNIHTIWNDSSSACCDLRDLLLKIQSIHSALEISTSLNVVLLLTMRDGL